MGAKLNNFRELVNLSIYDSKSFVIKILSVLRLLFSFAGLGSVVYFYGFPHDEESLSIQLIIIRVSLIFFIISFIIRFVYDFEPRKFLKENKYEGIILLIVLLDGFGIIFFGKPFLRHFSSLFGIHVFSNIFVIIVQSFLISVVALEFIKMSRKIGIFEISPSILFIGSFVFIILGGALMLMMPEMTSGGFMQFSDALFTSVSACCVTGLTVVDTATFFTFKGKFILMILMQIGGLNIIVFASFFAYFSQKGVGLRQQAMIMDFMSFESLNSTKKMLRDILMMAFGIEIIGAILLFFLWHPDLEFHSIGEKIFSSVFHAVSAFNNAGFSLYTNNLYEPIVKQNFMVHIVLGLLIVFGGLGFPVINDLFGRARLRERLLSPWKQPKVFSKIVLYTTTVLIISGAVVFYLIESTNPKLDCEECFGQMNFMEKLITSVFQSISTRTAGFNSVDFSVLSPPVLLFFIGLMFIGASPASTGGGIKTTTFALIFLSAIATIRNKKIIEVFRHSISEETVKRAYSIVLFSSVVIFTSAFIISISDPQLDLLKIFFEVVSAFCTVGLSTGITAGLSLTAKTVLMVCMFLGRVGILTFAIALSKRAMTNRYKHPDAFIMVG